MVSTPISIPSQRLTQYGACAPRRTAQVLAARHRVRSPCPNSSLGERLVRKHWFAQHAISTARSADHVLSTGIKSHCPDGRRPGNWNFSSNFLRVLIRCIPYRLPVLSSLLFVSAFLASNSPLFGTTIGNLQYWANPNVQTGPGGTQWPWAPGTDLSARRDITFLHRQLEKWSPRHHSTQFSADLQLPCPPHQLFPLQ